MLHCDYKTDKQENVQGIALSDDIFVFIQTKESQEGSKKKKKISTTRVQIYTQQKFKLQDLSDQSTFISVNILVTGRFLNLQSIVFPVTSHSQYLFLVSEHTAAIPMTYSLSDFVSILITSAGKQIVWHGMCYLHQGR